MKIQEIKDVSECITKNMTPEQISKDVGSPAHSVNEAYYSLKHFENNVEKLLSFYINKDGTITDIEVLVGLNDDIKKECIRIVSNLPKIVAGRINGENEKMQMLIPLQFNAPISYYDY